MIMAPFSKYSCQWAHAFHHLEFNLSNYSNLIPPSPSPLFFYVGFYCEPHSVPCLLFIGTCSPFLFQRYSGTCCSNRCRWIFGNVHYLLIMLWFILWSVLLSGSFLWTWKCYLLDAGRIILQVLLLLTRLTFFAQIEFSWWL